MFSLRLDAHLPIAGTKIYLTVENQIMNDEVEKGKFIFGAMWAVMVECALFLCKLLVKTLPPM